jgi:hypothetical protein
MSIVRRTWAEVVVSGSKPVLVSGECKVFVGDWQESFFENFDGWAEERDRLVRRGLVFWFTGLE